MALVLILLFIVLPIAELYVIIQVGNAIGLAPTLAILILDGFVGAALVRRQGRTAWERFNLALTNGRVPANETFDGAMIVFGGALLLAPGFITDVIGLALLIPPTRAVFKAVVARLARRRIVFGWAIPGAGTRGAGPRPRPPGPQPARGYDYEGTAHEVDEPAAEIDSGEQRE